MFLGMIAVLFAALSLISSAAFAKTDENKKRSLLNAIACAAIAAACALIDISIFLEKILEKI